jgi:type I restriction enzyme R subunit
MDITSGTVIDAGMEYTEPGMNRFGEKELPEKFDTDEYQILMVAEKYQTGFDQPLLHTMYVDKKLKDLKAVQTLSRLNRTCPGKEDTFILDFENEAEDIKEAFKPYYERTEIDEPTDPNQLYTLKTRLDAFQFYWHQEIEDFAKVFFKSRPQQNPKDQGLLHKYIDPAVTRFTEDPDEERQEEFRHLLGSYIRLYGFLSQMIDFTDADLEKLYAFARLLRTKLPQRDIGGKLNLDDEVALTYYRLDKTFEGGASLKDGDTVPVYGPKEVGTGKPKDEDKSPLSQIIEIINERFGTDFKPEDKLLFDQVVQDLSRDERLSEQARTNTIEQFKYAFDPKAIEAFIKRMERNEGIASQIMSNEDLRKVALELMMMEVYERAQDRVNLSP